jgi:hypothetical protein
VTLGYCRQPDHDNAKVICGYPIPCPYHTAITAPTGMTKARLEGWGGGGEVLYKVAAQGHFQTKLGRSSFSRAEATEIADDLRRRGYFDAHAQALVPGLGPLFVARATGKDP